MPVPDPNKEPGAFDSRTKAGLRVGYHRQPGGLFSGDYIIAEYDAFRLRPDVKPSNRQEIMIHRTKEMIIPPGESFVPVFPLVLYRAEQQKITDEPVEPQFLDEL